MAEKEFDVVVAGHVALDVIPDMSGLSGDLISSLRPGTLVTIGPVVASTGGPVSNTGISLHKLGVKTGFMGKVGDDFFGRELLDRFAKIGASDSMSVVEGESTSYSLVITPPGVDRMFLHHPGCNDTFGLADVKFGVGFTFR